MSEPHTADLGTRYRYRREGAELERERIIELLESKICSCVENKVNFNFDDKEQFMKHLDCDWQAMMVEYHIDLIKGEQK